MNEAKIAAPLADWGAIKLCVMRHASLVSVTHEREFLSMGGGGVVGCS